LSNNTRPDDRPIAIAEYRLLNALVKNPVFLADTKINEDLFYHTTAQSLFHALVSLVEDGVPLSEAAFYQKANEVDYRITQESIDHVFKVDDNGATYLDDILETLHKAKIKREVLNSTQNAVIEAGKNGDLNVEAVSQYLEEAQEAILSKMSKSKMKDFDALLRDYQDQLRARLDGKQYPYGDLHLDKFSLKGAYPGAYTVIAADTGMGKTTFVLNLINGMINQGIPCMYFSLEMSETAIMDRLMGIRRNLPQSALFDINAIDNLIELVEQERQSLVSQRIPFEMVDDAGINLKGIKKCIRDFKRKYNVDYLVIFVDLLTQLPEFTDTGRGGGNLANKIEAGINEWNRLLKDENVHGVGVVQFRRDVESGIRIKSYDDLYLLRPMLHHIKNSGAIAERSRLVLSCFRAKHYGIKYIPDDPQVIEMDDQMEISIMKQNDGELGRFYYTFDGQVFTITPILDQSQELTQEELDKKEAIKHLSY